MQERELRGKNRLTLKPEQALGWNMQSMSGHAFGCVIINKLLESLFQAKHLASLDNPPQKKNANETLPVCKR